MATTETVIDIKKSFLLAQCRILNTALELPRDWHENVPHDDLKDKEIREVLRKVNTIIQYHNRTAYSSQALRHVAEQIAHLYWGFESLNDAKEHEEDLPGRDTDFRDASAIAILPEEWPGGVDVDESGLENFAESRRYMQLQRRLVALDEQRTAQQLKLARYKYLQTLLDPFRNPQENIQPNLVTKDGELSKELGRMKLLMARMGEKIRILQETAALRGQDDDTGKTAQDRIDAIMPRDT